MKNAPNKPSQMTAFNIRFPMAAVVLVASVWGLLTLTEEWKELRPICILMLIVSGILMFCIPVYYVFSKKGLQFVYFFGYRKHLPWLQVDGISEMKEYGKLALNKLYSKITVHYHMMFRGRSIQHFHDLPNTKRLKLCFKKYYTGYIHFEDEPKKKKKR